jgi:hypothetical protein
MAVEDDDPTTGNEVQDNAPDQGNIPGPNPAWNDVLNVLPEQFHSVVTPHFAKWDQAAQSRIEAANASLKEYESYKPFVEHGITNEEIEQGLRILYEINNNPQNVYTALGNAYKFGQTTEPPVDEGTEEPEPSAQYQKLEQGLELVSKIVLADAQAKQDAQADIELDRELEALKEKHGEYDLRYVLAMMQNGMSGEEAVQSFNELKNSFAPKQNSFAPSILGGNKGGAGIPSGAIDPTKLSSGETRNLVAQMLAAAKNQN